MALTDPIADMLTIMRNASRARKTIVEVKGSKLTEGIIELFKKNGFISNYKTITDTKQGVVRIYLKYMKSGSPAIIGIKRISKPGLRMYKRCDELPKVFGGLGIAIISTSKGLMTDDEAREKKLGGEILCTIW